ncbi:zinc ribbon domain-containing protein [Promethearchaeum syntrophicum]|uniref:Zinc ribbon domain-containing protein n=1 Tax=Promethearchaeum syntrophicum TaxID=2594042 RepID=A0A5B9D6C5_9ARCH|nr:zinc ribbon domain-containing protein [Candidatus Prometheoarchaeum syntrophicum]
MAIDESNYNFQKLGKSMKMYAFGIIIVQLISFMMGIYLAMVLLSLATTTNPEQALYDFIETSKNIVLYTGVLSIIIYTFFGNFIKEIFNLSKIYNENSEILNKTFLILLIGLLTQIIVDIVASIISYQALSRVQIALSSFSNVTETELNQILIEATATNFIIQLFILIPLGLILYGYISFKQFGNKLRLSNFENPNSINVDHGINFLFWGSIINLIVGFLNLIPDAPLVGLLGFMAVIFTLVGLFKAGKGFVSYSRTAQFYKSPDIYSSQDTSQNFSSQDQMGQFNHNSPQNISGISAGNTENLGKFCHICGTKQIDPNSKYCSNCGTPLN